MTANIVPITDNVPALRDESLNQPPTGARRRTSNLMVIAAVTTRTRTSAATQMRTATTLEVPRGSQARNKYPMVYAAAWSSKGDGLH
jgi:hypothetical protein